MARTDLTTDVVIVGSSLVGAALGIALGQAGVGRHSYSQPGTSSSGTITDATLRQPRAL